MSDKLDYKKEFKDLYMPKNKPSLIDVPPMNFILINGKGSPQQEEYQNAISILYALSFTIKMSKMSGNQPQGYFEYVVPPLEGLWWCENGGFDFEKRDIWRWTSMMRQPEFVTMEVFKWAFDECKKKKPELDISRARFEQFTEDLCVQMMHTGPYSDEPKSIEMMGKFVEESNLVDVTGIDRKHHEIYLSDPRKTAPEKLRTVLRHPVEKRIDMGRYGDAPVY
ncbi:hypothetical protein DFR58_108112 [Anaerobacterium chartisolvens]|uniref:GyrI-like small molecule binding domain-containing protein n=1 Tax=Anaerobacterium chartisolvens TaxID=1297424 RepID=A0A369B9F2_9FIRM|nr:GyrI-like domain-containing protein [Anaerobacterium chartisolvens]RCX17218.1 hypothetical protein DFR58_108112 [Anaerobacterium chartisolvens]